MAQTTGTASPYVPYMPYPGNASSTGGDPLTQDLNLYYESGDIAWMITATALVLLMVRDNLLPFSYSS